MGYTHSDWTKRLRSRSDMSSYLYHLTRGNGDINALDILIKILNEKTLVGSNQDGFVCGSLTATCFQDVPLYSLCQNSYHEQTIRKETGGKLRYKPIGLAFNKRYVYESGGRPVFYEHSSVAKKLLPPDEWWRIVSFDLSDKDNIIDWTHEREWRVKGDFMFELKDVVVVLTKKSLYSLFISKVDSDILKEIGGICILDLSLS